MNIRNRYELMKLPPAILAGIAAGSSGEAAEAAKCMVVRAELMQPYQYDVVLEYEEFPSITEGGYEFRQCGNWLYYGSGGEFYAKTSAKELAEFLDTEGSTAGEPAPFPVAIPASGDAVHMYDANDNEPASKVRLAEYNSEFGTKYKDFDEFFAEDES